ncbi:high affinity glucose transporter [Exophiala oligosperma]
MKLFYASFSQYVYYALPIFLAGFTYGWENASMGGILAMPQFLDYFNNPSAFRQGVLTAGLQAGEFGGSLIFGLLVPDRFGRRITILSAIAVYLVGQAIVVSSTTQAQFIVGRVINGLGAGAFFQTISLFTAEISPKQIRGQLTSFLNTGLGLGLLVAYWVQYGTAGISGNASWRVPLGLQLVPAFIVGVMVIFRPETPRYLVRHDRQDEALEVLAKLRSKGVREDPLVQAELQEIRVIVEFEKQTPTPSYGAILFSKRYRRRTAIGMGVQFLQQATGVNVCLYYASKVFAQTGRTATSATLLANGINSALNFASSASLTVLTDWYGRRLPLILGPFLMGICFILVGTILKEYGSPHFDKTTQAVQFNFQNASAGNAAIAFMFLYNVAFGGLYSSVPWTYPNEVFSVDARARGTALSTSTNWFVNFWLSLYAPQALNKGSWRVYIGFAVINFFCSVVAYLFFPETAGRSLEEIDLLFLPSRSVWVTRDRQARSKDRLIEHDFSAGAESVGHDLEVALAVGVVAEKGEGGEKVASSEIETVKS